MGNLKYVALIEEDDIVDKYGKEWRPPVENGIGQNIVRLLHYIISFKGIVEAVVCRCSSK